MRKQFIALLLTVAAAFAAPAAAAPEDWVQPPAKLPPVERGDTKQNLDFLFGALKVAPNDETAKAIEQHIWALWASSRSDTTMLLMTRAQTAMEQHDIDLALHWALGREGIFAISSGDTALLPKVLDAASRFQQPPSTSEMRAMVSRLQMEPLFV